MSSHHPKRTYNLWLNLFTSKTQASHSSNGSVEFFVNWDETLPDEHEFYKITFAFYTQTTNQMAVESPIITANFKDKTFVSSNDGLNTKQGFYRGLL